MCVFKSVSKMLLFQTVLLLFLPIIYGKSPHVTFQNVHFQGYLLFTPKFRPTILSGNSLRDFLPNTDFDTIEFLNQDIPVLYENSIANIDGMIALIIESCTLAEIRPGAFRRLPMINRISLRANKIDKIENGVFNNLPLHSLDLSYNQLSTIHPQAFDDMPHIYYINLSHNFISKWDPNWFKNTPELSTVYMKNNLIEYLPEHSFRNFDTNKIKVRDMNFIFSNNKISDIHPQAFVDVKRIHQLSFSDNSLKNFNKELIQDVVIDDLRLNNNSIECFNEGDFDAIFKGPSVYIEFNPFDCECVRKLQKWSRKHEKNLGVDDIKCGKDEPSVVDIEQYEISNDTFFVDRITLVLPQN